MLKVYSFIILTRHFISYRYNAFFNSHILRKSDEFTSFQILSEKQYYCNRSTSKQQIELEFAIALIFIHVFPHRLNKLNVSQINLTIGFFFQ